MPKTFREYRPILLEYVRGGQAVRLTPITIDRFRNFALENFQKLFELLMPQCKMRAEDQNEAIS